MNSIVKLKENYCFRRAYRKGAVYVSPYFVIYAVKSKKNIRLGITAGKKLGGAVKRNRAKRVITAAFRECLPHILPGYDFVIVARTRILNAKSTETAASMRKIFTDAGIWNDTEINEQNFDLAD